VDGLCSETMLEEGKGTRRKIGTRKGGGDIFMSSSLVVRDTVCEGRRKIAWREKRRKGSGRVTRRDREPAPSVRSELGGIPVSKRKRAEIDNRVLDKHNQKKGGKN